MLKCPCQRCSLAKFKSRVDIEGDLMLHGFLSTYTNWYLHGEDLEDTRQAFSLDHQPNVNQSDSSTFIDSSTFNLLADIFPSMKSHPPNIDSDPPNIDSDPPNIKMESDDLHEDPLKEKKAFDELLSDCSQALYEGCQSFSKLTFMLKLYHIKCLSRISGNGMSMIINLLKEAFEHARFPDSFSDMKKTIRKLGLTYLTIHVCPNDCMLYWGEDSSREKCKVCENSRWKASRIKEGDTMEKTKKKKKKKKQQAAKILRYFPLKPRLQRLFMSSKTAQHMRWHAESENKDGKLRHPRDGMS
ncbi:unnamed protein product [Microthlaspi erraticum]|uniref:Transposase-associated domain-containing protein n=1 Tax=Microthlaspi erraticum TaxID=1685480 RepID=A0A6D2ICX8_9BRAS|nr:unnamed protein product [Microthlaspi erraticum]